MIKAEDLRIGDLVRVRKMKFFSFIIPEDVAYKVTQIISKDSLINNRSSVCLCLTNPKQNQTEYPTTCESLLPIPLTPEILEKNGWRKRTEGWYFMMISKYMYLSVEFGYDNGIRVFLKRTTDGLYVKLNVANNVHELQHILWALGLDAELKV